MIRNRTRRRRRPTFAAAVLASALLLAACGGDDDRGETATDEDGSTGEPGEEGPAEDPADDPANGAGSETAADAVTVVLSGTGTTFDPSSTNMGDVSQWGSGNVYEWLVDRDPETNETIPVLAESWEFSEDGTSIQFTLRDGVTFHNGAPLTSEDVKFTWERMAEYEQTARFSRFVEDIEIVDDLNFIIHFGQVDVGFIPGNTFAIQSKSHFDEVGEDEFLRSAVGTGPYQVTDISPGEYIEAEYYADYWGDEPAIKNVRWEFVADDSTRVSMLRAGDADAVIDLPPSLIAEVQSDGSFNVETQERGGYSVWLDYQNLDPETPWSDERVRRAMALAIDETAIIENVLFGGARHLPSLAPGDLGYDESIEPYGHDPDRARELLEEAGYPDGFSATLNYMTGAAAGVNETAETLVLYLQQVGIDLRAEPLEPPQFQALASESSGNPDADYLALFVGTISGGVEPSLGLNTHMSSASRFARYFNEDVDALLDEASRTVDDDERDALLQEVANFLHEDVAYIPIFTVLNHYVLPQGWSFTPREGNYRQFRIADIGPA